MGALWALVSDILECEEVGRVMWTGGRCVGCDEQGGTIARR